MRITLHAKMVAKQDDFYPLMVFQNLDERDNSLLRYITVTLLPNWNGKLPELNEVGFLSCEYVDAGEEYYQRRTGNKEQYKYTSCYFLNFIKERQEQTTTDYKF